MSNITYPFDSRLEHRALGSAALTATTVLDTIDQRVAQRTMFMTKVILEAIDIANSDETYQVVVEVSDDNFTTVNEIAAILDLGDTAVRQSGAPDNAAGDEFDIYWASEVNGVKYRYARIKLFAGGTSPSITLGCHSSTMPKG